MHFSSDNVVCFLSSLVCCLPVSVFYFCSSQPVQFEFEQSAAINKTDGSMVGLSPKYLIVLPAGNFSTSTTVEWPHIPGQILSMVLNKPVISRNYDFVMM